jgi:hypothetical protein
MRPRSCQEERIALARAKPSGGLKEMDTDVPDRLCQSARSLSAPRHEFTTSRQVGDYEVWSEVFNTLK